jgi:hypothetical protein
MDACHHVDHTHLNAMRFAAPNGFKTQVPIAHVPVTGNDHNLTWQRSHGLLGLWTRPVPSASSAVLRGLRPKFASLQVCTNASPEHMIPQPGFKMWTALAVVSVASTSSSACVVTTYTDAGCATFNLSAFPQQTYTRYVRDCMRWCMLLDFKNLLILLELSDYDRSVSVHVHECTMHDARTCQC